MFAKVLDVRQGQGDPGAVDVVRADKDFKVRDLTVNARDDAHAKAIVEAIKHIQGVTVVHISDRVFLLHLGGKIRIQNKVPLTTRDTLSMAYTPGVARVCMAIHEDENAARTLTIKQNSVAVVSDGTAVLGLGDIGPKAAMPVMEGKACSSSNSRTSMPTICPPLKARRHRERGEMDFSASARSI